MCTTDRRTVTPGTICPRCGISLVTGKPTPNCVTDGREAHDVWCADENYADDPCATCMAASPVQAAGRDDRPHPTPTPAPPVDARHAAIQENTS